MTSLDENIPELINRIESTNDVEKRLNLMQSLQSELEACDRDQQLHSSTYDSISNLLKSTLKNPHQSIFLCSLSLLTIYSPLASASTHPAHNLRSLISSSMLLALEKLGDGKDRVRESARKALVELGSSAYTASGGGNGLSSSLPSKGKEAETPLATFERLLRDNGLGAKSPRVKEQASSLVHLLRLETPKFPIRPFLPHLVDLLSDADPSVRDSARLNTIRLFKNPNVTSSAKSDLKKEMEKKGTRKQTAEAILKEVLGGGDLAELDDAVPSGNGKATPAAANPGAASMGTSEDDVSPVYVASKSDLDRTFSSMLPFFEGKETEHNWLNRESSIIKIRGMLATNAHQRFSSNFTAGIKSMQEGIVKTLVSLRTTLANHTIFLLAELARKVGDDLDTSAETFFSALLKMAGFTKKIVATGSQHSASEFLTHLSFRHHFLYLVSQGFLEKNQNIRIFMCDHLNTILKVHGSKKHQVESHDGLQAIETSLKKGLNDPNPEVRSKSRDAFFKFEAIWKESAQKIYEGLETNIKKQVNTAREALGKNGSSTTVVTAPKSVPTASTNSASTTAAPRRPGGPSAAIMAAKRAASQRIAKEKKEKEEEEERERDAAFEEIDERRRNPSLDSTPPAASTPSQAQQGPHPSASTTRRPRPISVISPKSTLREASTIPLPGSSPSNHSSSIHQRTSSASGLLVRSRTSSSGSHSTAGSQGGTPRQTSSSSTTTSSSASRAQLKSPSGGSTPSHIPRARTTSSSSSTSSVRSTGASTGKLSTSGRRPPVSSSQSSRAYHLRSPESTAADDTLQFPSEEPSMDLMAFSSPLRSKGHMDQSIVSDMTFQTDNSISADETAGLPNATGDHQAAEEAIARVAADAKKAAAEMENSSESQYNNRDEPNPSTPKMTSSGLPGSAGINLSRSPNSQNPSSTQKRSGLPRPVSMLHRGHYPTDASSPISASALSRHAPARSLDATSMLNSSQQKQRHPSASSDVSTISHEGPLPTLSASSSMTSVAGSSLGTVASHFDHTPTSKASNLWFLNRSSRLDSADDSTSSPIKAKPESNKWIESLKDGTADLKVFRRLAKLSSEFKLPIVNASSNGLTDEMVLQPGRSSGNREKSNGGALGLQKMGEDELTRDDEERAIDAWTESNLFVRLFDGLCVFLDGENQSEDLKSAALVLLNRLFDHQYALFVSSSKETDLLSLLIRLNKSCTKSKSIQKGCDTILDAWTSRSNPIIGFGRMADCLRDGLKSLNVVESKGEKEKKEAELQRVRIFSLGLRGLGNLLKRLPMELVEEELPRASDLIRTAFNDTNADLRQMAVTTACSAHRQLKDPKKLFELIGPLDQQQEHLLTYYFVKSLKS